jgi:hypothetical protein
MCKTIVEAWPRHHVITLLLGFVLHKAEDFVASFIQHVFATHYVFFYFFLRVKGLRLLL